MAWKDEYDQVEDRLKKFWKEYPNGRIETDIITISEDHMSAVHKAEIYKDINDARPVATGIAQDQHGPVGANQTSWIENGETSAIGRALANWIYAAKKRPSVTEMQKVKNLSQSQVTKSEAKTGNSNSYTPSPSVQEKIKDAPKLDDKDTKGALEEIGVVVQEKVVVTHGTVDPKCLSCNSELWDNRLDKASGKIKETYPDWKCKNRECKSGKGGMPRAYYMDSYVAEQTAPEEWYMPSMPEGKAIEDISPDKAPF